ncbi:malonate decarboxylase holo-[acyl-carrier-protein] synthase [Rhizobium laguerreae]|uniref:malonate decarboxylase holo-[acyl-carrier-protein] synthase n=1 Tax=Rhizobium laguerreae TaxID=1076926 RepID=UPI001C91BF3A|nr:malonate decarboxylase holo-[acyl-carrier-protein] synthase [Rhizobium laguerreae]MBY3537545.1 malonate decarboxylase holo-[acyl-carrier-protein] synthase [Rhizobium laguerreae]
MHSRSPRKFLPLRRHDLVVIEPRPEAPEPMISMWCENGWPLVARRPTSSDADGVALGLPLPPSQGKKRLSLVVQIDEILSVQPPLALDSVTRMAPQDWLPTVERIAQLAIEHELDVRVFGSLGWSVVTGLDYLTSTSDLDLLLYVAADTDLERVIGRLAQIQAMAPMRLDGEFVRGDGVGANWQEFRRSAGDVLVKSLDGAAFVDRRRFLVGSTAI